MATTDRPTRHLLPSLTRIADLDRVPFDVAPVDRAAWRTGQYVSVAIAGRRRGRTESSSRTVVWPRRSPAIA